jgi:hypothetical protein
MLKKIQGHISSLRNKVSENFQKSFIALTVVAVVLGGFFVAGSALAATLTVGSSEFDNFTTIQDAVNEAADGDTINVAAGTYDLASAITVNKSITILGAKANIDPRLSNGGRSGEESIIAGDTTAFDIQASDVEINGFTIESSINNKSLNIVQESDKDQYYNNINVSYNVIYNTDYSGGTMNEAIKIRTGNSAYVAYNYIYDIPSPGDGINFDRVTDGIIEYNELRNQGSENAAIYVYDSKGTDIIGNLVYDVDQNDGIKLGAKDGADANKTGGLIKDNTVYNTTQDGISIYMSNVTVEGNEVYNSTSENGAIYIAYAVSNITITGNTVRDNTLNAAIKGNPGAITIGTAVDAATVIINYNKIYGNAPNNITNNAIDELNATNNWWGTAVAATIAAEKISGLVIYDPYYIDEGMTILNSEIPTTVYVDDDYADGDSNGYYFGYDAFNTILEGINAVAENGTVNVATGTYDGAITINKPLTIKGAGSEETIIDAGAVLPVINIDSSNVTLEGLKVANGNWGVGVRNASDIENINFKDVVVDGSTASGFVFDGLGKVSNITFTDCRADNNGNRGIYFNQYKPSENITLINTSADNNQVMGFNNQGIMTNLRIEGGTFNNNAGGIPKNTDDNPLYGFGISVENTTGVDIQEVTAENNGIEGPAEGGAGIVIKGSSSGVNISDVILTGNKIGLWLEPKWGSNPVPEDTTITNSKVFNNVDYEVKNDIGEIIVSAVKNWWGTFSPTGIAAKISDNVLYEPYCAVADCSLIYNEITEADSPLAGANMAIPKSAGATSTSTPSVTFLSTATITVTDGGGESTVTIPEGVVITRADGENLDTTLLTSSSVDSTSLAGLGTGVVAEGALQWGIENIGLEFNPAITISIFVGTDLNGQTLDITRSTSGSGDWTDDGISPTSCVVSDGLCTFETTKASYFAATSITPPPAPASRRRGGTSSEIVFLKEEAVVEETEEIVIPETTEELPESVVEEEIPLVPFTEAEELLTPEEVTPFEEVAPSEEVTPSEEAASHRKALVFPPAEVVPELGLASLFLATIGVIRESAWMSITVIFCLAGLAVIGIREWELVLKRKRQ